MLSVHYVVHTTKKQIFRIILWLGRVILPQTIHNLNRLETGIDYIQTELTIHLFYYCPFGRILRLG